MFVQFNVSPARKPKPQKIEKKEEPEINILSLAPFTPNPKICFDNVKIGDEAKRQLLIRNPNKLDVELQLTRLPPPERDVGFNWSRKLIPAGDDVLLEIIWHPCIEGAWRDYITLEDGNRIKRDVPLVFKSIRPKGAKKNGSLKKSATYVSKKNISPVKKLQSTKRLKSPVKSYQSDAHRRPVLPNITNVPKICITSPQHGKLYSISNKENYSSNNCHSGSSSFIFTSPTAFNMQPTNILNRRETFTLKQTISERNNEDNFNDSLETKSPEMLSAKRNTEDVLLKKFGTTSFLFSPQVNLNNTYDMQNNDTGANLHNISGNTYVKGNLSSDTYVKGDLSIETNVKGNISSATYTKDVLSPVFLSPISSRDSIASQAPHDLTSFFLSRTPAVFNLNEAVRVEEANTTIESNLRRNDDFKRKQINSFINDTIFEDRSFVSTQSFLKGTKRKSTELINTIPNKKTICGEDVPTPRDTWSTKPFVPPKKMRDSIIKLNLFKEKKPVSNSQTEAAFWDPFSLAATNDIDPFITADLYSDPKWLEEQVLRFQKWLNALLTPPEELDTNDMHPVDVAKLWQECKKRDVKTAPTKEVVSNKYNTNKHLEALRASAAKLYRSPEVCDVLRKTLTTIETGKLAIRVDKDVHLDLGIQQEIMTVILCYNPLWLRIGLETIYNTVIPLRSNSDIIGLTNFLMNRFFKDPFLISKHKSVHAPKYTIDIKKYMLKKFLSLVYFLDKAKEKKLIGHDPCLFRKNALLKQSRDILLRFCSVSVSAIGDITKFLRYTGYFVTHQQTYIHEYDYAVNKLGVDLRDGVRLTRIMEIILLREDLTRCLRVPAISRLQKIHNVKVAFEALSEAGFEILHDITPKDIVDGHKEKTLSFLWQIIHKFQAPRFTKAAKIIQQWFRSLKITIKRRILSKEMLKYEKAAEKIQKWYRRIKLASKLEYIAPFIKKHIVEYKNQHAAIVIQSYVRMFLQRKKFVTLKKSVLLIQAYSRRVLCVQKLNWAALKIQNIMKTYVARKRYLQLKSAVCTIEIRYIAKQHMQVERLHYEALKRATIKIQRHFRASVLMKKQRDHFQTIKSAAIQIQTWFRATLQMQQEKMYFRQLLWAVTVVQKRYRATLLMKRQREYFSNLKKAAILVQSKYKAIICRNEFLKLKHHTVIIQKRVRANKLMRYERQSYLKLKKSVIAVQKRYRAIKQMKADKAFFESLKQATLFIQHLFKANLKMKLEKKQYHLLKNSVIVVQRRFRRNKLAKLERANFLNIRSKAIFVQHRYRALKSMKFERDNYQRLRNSVIFIQQCFRANILMRIERQQFQSLKQQTIVIQRRFRANKLMKLERNNYLLRRNAAVKLQRLYRGYCLMKIEQRDFQVLKMSTILIQKKFRALRQMREDRNRYTDLKLQTIKLQRWFRANKLMKLERNNFIGLRKAAVILQHAYRAYYLMKVERNKYQTLREYTILMQRRFKGNQAMKEAKKYYTTLRLYTLKLQRHFRANQLMKVERSNYNNLKKAAIIVQRRYRATRLMENERNYYFALKLFTLYVQRRFRANKLMQLERDAFLIKKNATVAIQRYYRAYCLKKINRDRFQTLKRSAILIQRIFRASKLMKQERNYYMALKLCVISMQRRFRANKKMKLSRDNYKQLKKSATIIQHFYRAYRLKKTQLHEYQTLKKSAVVIQRRFRAKQAMKTNRQYYLALKTSAVKMQRLYRAKRLMKITRENYVNQRKIAIVIQRFYRSYRLTKSQQREYQTLKKHVVIIQKRFRANQLMKKERTGYLALKSTVVHLQAIFRAKKLMEIERDRYIRQKHAAIIIQRFYRAYQMMKQDRQFYLYLKSAARKIQRLYRAKLLMKITRGNYLKQKKSAVILQRYYRAHHLKTMQQNYYQSLKKSAVIIQKRFRLYQLMKKERAYYLALKSAIINIQKRFRAKKLMQIATDRYTKQKHAALVIQHFYRANRMMKQEKHSYLTLKSEVCKIQRLFRAKVLAKTIRDNYLKQKKSAIVIQRYYRGYRLKTMQQHYYHSLKKAAVVIQKRFRLYQLMKKERAYYLTLKSAVVKMQEIFKAKKLMKIERDSYIKHKRAAVIIQEFYRAYSLKKMHSNDYQALRKSVINVQRIFRANQMMKREQNYYVTLKQSAVIIQRCFRAKQLMKLDRDAYMSMKNAAIIIQRFYRAYCMRKTQQMYYQTLKKSAIVIQRRFRANQMMTVQRKDYLKLKMSTIAMQQRYQANKLMKLQKDNYLNIKNAAVVLQRYYKAHRLKQMQHSNFQTLKKSVVLLQKRYREYQLMKAERSKYLTLKTYTVKIQQHFRANKLMKYEREKYMKLRNAAICIQRFYRAVCLKRVERNNYLVLQKSCIIIQRRYRGLLAMRMERRKFCDLRKQAIVLQRAIRARALEKAAQTKTTLPKIFVSPALPPPTTIRKRRSIKNENSSTPFVNKQSFDEVLQYLSCISSEHFITSTPIVPNEQQQKTAKEDLGSTIYLSANADTATATKEGFYTVLTHSDPSKDDTNKVPDKQTLERLNVFSRPFSLSKSYAARDPFISIDVCDSKWLREQERRFEKWLNVLMTPPEVLNADDTYTVDVVKLWEECNKGAVMMAPTKEVVSNKYYTNNRLDALRNSAARLFQSEVLQIANKISDIVDNEKLIFRVDKELHLDFGIQYNILSLILCYNPLWLRLGLETLYNTIIPLRNNSDVVGLTSFLYTNFFRDQKLSSKYRSVKTRAYAADLKKFVLKKFLTLIYFLDRAKTVKLIAHDPCLFRKTSAFKESRKILIQFASDILYAVGDITKLLRSIGCIVTHVQKCIHEYNYAVSDLRVDLRDGVRLTRVMEIILLEDNLTRYLRVPAISRLQKIHNVEVAFSALTKAGFEILNGITAKDIVSGHKEKTLSLLWQIVYKFQAPRIIKAVTTIQEWYRSLPVTIKRRILAKKKQKFKGPVFSNKKVNLSRKILK